MTNNINTNSNEIGSLPAISLRNYLYNIILIIRFFHQQYFQILQIEIFIYIYNHIIPHSYPVYNHQVSSDFFVLLLLSVSKKTARLNLRMVRT